MLPQQIRAAYVHWPFCQRKCAYCDFISWPSQTGQTDLYVHCLLNEIEAVGAWSVENGLSVPLTSVFFGGGTPSLASPDQLMAILGALSARFGLATDAEITLEANPGTVTSVALRQLRAAGFNRISFGLQAAQDELLQTLGRIHTCADFVASVQAAHAAGFERISADLMLGLPSQTLADVEASLDLLLDLGIDHISYYSLIIEPGTPFADRYLDRPDLLPDDQLERQMYHGVQQRLAANGVFPYEISNAAKPGDECRHNLVYWHGLPYYGFGVAAHSYAAGVRRGNTDKWLDYLQIWGGMVHATRPAGWPFLSTVSAENIDETEAQKEMFLLGLRLTDGVTWADFSDRFGRDRFEPDRFGRDRFEPDRFGREQFQDARELFAAQFAALQQRGLLVCDERGARLTELGLDFANQVFAEFV